MKQQLYALRLRYIAFDSNNLDSVLCLQLALGLIGSIPIRIEPCNMTDLGTRCSFFSLTMSCKNILQV